MLEKHLVTKIIKTLRAEYGGSYWLKIPGNAYMAGVPDILGCVEGNFIAIEVKRSDTSYTVTPRQEANLAQIATAGGTSGVATSPEEALEIVRRVCQ